MTDRVNCLTVVLDKDYRIDDIEGLSEAIRQFKGVIAVKENVSSPADSVARLQVKYELTQKIYDILKL